MALCPVCDGTAIVSNKEVRGQDANGKDTGVEMFSCSCGFSAEFPFLFETVKRPADSKAEDAGGKQKMQDE